jgi:hypothetical protein
MTDTFGPPPHDNDNVDPDAPLRLADAVRICFPHGGMTVSGLRREAKAGRLVTEKIANKQFTTPRSIEQMRKLCRVEARDRACGGEKNAAAGAKSLHKEHGLSLTVGSITPRDALLAKIEKRKSA